MSASAELQKLAFDAMTGSPTLMAILNGVYDQVPRDPFGSKTAYGSFGPSDVVDDSADCIIIGRHSLQIDIWSRAVGQVEAKRAVDLIYRLFHEQSFSLAENALVQLRVDLRRVMPDRDPKLTHGIVTLSATIEEPS